MILGGNQYPPKQCNNSDQPNPLRTIYNSSARTNTIWNCRESNNTMLPYCIVEHRGRHFILSSCMGKFWECHLPFPYPLSHTHTHTMQVSRLRLRPKLSSPIHLLPGDERWVLGSFQGHPLIQQIYVHHWQWIPMCIFRWSETQRRGNLCGTLNPH